MASLGDEVIDIEMLSNPENLATATSWNGAARMILESAPPRDGKEGLSCCVSDEA